MRKLDSAYAGVTSKTVTIIGNAPRQRIKVIRALLLGLTLTLPASNAQYNIAVVTLDLPNLHLNQPNDLSSPLAGQVEIVAPFFPAGIVFADGTISTDIPKLQQSGKKPITIVLRVPLGSGTQSVMAEWATVNGIINTDTFGSLSAILGRQ